MFEQREGETALADDPATTAADAGLVFIGRIRSPWKTRADCPRNMAAARATGQAATIEIEPQFRPGLDGLAGTSHIVVLSWLGFAPRNLIVQKPRHAAQAKGVFALRSPARPNPVGLHVARLVSLDAGAGLLSIDAIDVLDGTAVVDLKPYFASIDSFPDALPPRHRDAP
ncbi:MAG TPA: tRNA (N6-threonylcarbamoyladenosine(37)-N6)-methyltransferase TrmO [Rhizobiaceae bacterium]